MSMLHRRGLELIRPGARCCDIAEELNEIFIKHDLLQYRTFGYGHSFGMSFSLLRTGSRA